MITVKLKNKHEIPSRWSDFTPQMKDQFIALACAMDDFERGIFTFEQFKLCIVVSLLGVQLFDLMRRMLEFDPAQRITLAEALLHPFFAGLTPEERSFHTSRNPSR